MSIHLRSGRSSAARTLELLLLIILLPSCSAIRDGVAAERPAEARCAESIPDVFDRVSPAVVFISATSVNPYRLSDRVTRVVGSGVIIDSSGLILTNSHLVSARQSITATLDDGTSGAAQLVGADPILDLAVLRIPWPSERTLPAAELGDSDRVRVGDEVLAIGNPLGFNQTLTRGVVSAIKRILPETPFSLLEPLIQTDTPINPGNSGGPLLNRCGEVIGITTAIIPDAQNIGFVIPINLARSVLPSLVSQGRVIRPWIGFHGQLVEDAIREFLRLPFAEGLLVEVVEPGSPAERAGLRGGQRELVIDGHEFLVDGDIITSLNGTPLSSRDKLVEVMRGLKVGASASLTVFRSGECRVVEYALPERPALPGTLFRQGSLAPGGLRLRTR